MSFRTPQGEKSTASNNQPTMGSKTKLQSLSWVYKAFPGSKSSAPNNQPGQSQSECYLSKIITPISLTHTFEGDTSLALFSGQCCRFCLFFEISHRLEVSFTSQFTIHNSQFIIHHSSFPLWYILFWKPP